MDTDDWVNREATMEIVRSEEFVRSRNSIRDLAWGISSFVGQISINRTKQGLAVLYE